MSLPTEDKMNEMLSDLVAIVKKWTADGVNPQCSAGEMGAKIGQEDGARAALVTAASHISSRRPNDQLAAAIRQVLSPSEPS